MYILYNYCIMNFKKQIFAMARQDLKTLVFPEAGLSDTIVFAVKTIVNKKLAKVILIGDPSAFFSKYSNLESENLKIINPSASPLCAEVERFLLSRRGDKGITPDVAAQLAQDHYYFSAALVALSYADGIVCGSEGGASKTLRPALEIIKGKESGTLLSSGMIFVGKTRTFKRPVLLADPALVQNPSASQLVDIAKCSVDLWKTIFLEEPKVAFLSYSTNQSANGESVDKMRVAAQLFAMACPEVISGGEMQLDCALSPRAQAKKLPGCRLRGDANILIVPDINAGNILAKSLGVVAGLSTVGAIGLGFAKPISILGTIATADEIVMTAAITAILAQVD